MSEGQGAFETAVWELIQVRVPAGAGLPDGRRDWEVGYFAGDSPESWTVLANVSNLDCARFIVRQHNAARAGAAGALAVLGELVAVLDEWAKYSPFESRVYSMTSGFAQSERIVAAFTRARELLAEPSNAHQTKPAGPALAGLRAAVKERLRDSMERLDRFDSPAMSAAVSGEQDALYWVEGQLDALLAQDAPAGGVEL